MPDHVADVVVIVDVLWLLLLGLFYSEPVGWILLFLEGVFDVPGLLFLWPPPHAAVRQNPVKLFVAQVCGSGDDDCDNDHEKNDPSKHA